MRQHAHAVLSGNYLLADRAGTVSAVEVASGAVTPRPESGPSLVCTNRWEQHPMHPGNDWGSETAAQRFSRATGLLADDVDGIDHLARALRDHRDNGTDAHRPYGVSICNHGREQGTISAELLDIPRAWLWWTHGWPCGRRRGYELSDRTPWGRFIAFAVERLQSESLCELTTLDGAITPAGARLIANIEQPRESDATLRPGHPLQVDG